MTITEGVAAVTLNFTLTPLPGSWSATHDFNLTRSVAPSDPLSIDQLFSEISTLAEARSDLVSLRLFGTGGGGQLPVVEVTSGARRRRGRETAAGEEKVGVALIGRLRGDEPIGTEIVVRFLRHLVAG